MKISKGIWKLLLAALAMLIFIFDAKSAIQGAREGISLCLQTIIPSLFPFFVLSAMLSSGLGGMKIPLLSGIVKLLHIPQGAENIYLTGILGGYPVGAQIIAQEYGNGQLAKEDAQRMLAFCNNCGPAFIFGIGSTLFSSSKICLLVWAIHVLSSLLVGWSTPVRSSSSFQKTPAEPLSLTGALKQSVMSMGLICGWVILFRVLLTFLDKWILWILPTTLKLCLYGLIELSNGSCSLTELDSIGLRMILFSGFLSFGGFCVAFQTRSIIEGKHLDFRYYLPGKFTQGAISVLLAMYLQLILPPSQRWVVSPIPVGLCAVICIAYYLLNRNVKKAVAIRQRVMYNKKKST